jgi:hypothetical protein
MFELYCSFSDYIRDYDIQRSEGLLLRHLNSVYKVLTQTVPDSAKNDLVREMEVYLGALIRQVDSSLLDEWEKMRDPGFMRGETQELLPPGAEEAARDITRDVKGFTAAIRNRIFTFLHSLLVMDFEEGAALLAQFGPAEAEAADENGEPWTQDRLKTLLEGYRAGHGSFRLDPEGRNARHTYALPAEDKKTWRIQQMLVDVDETNDWVAEFEADLDASRAAGVPVLRLQRLGDYR